MAVFIVMLAITLLTGLGIWASRAASLVDVASGHNRQAIQSQYIAALGIEATSAFLADNRGDTYVKMATANQNSGNGAACTQNGNEANAFCYWFDPAELNVFDNDMVAPATSVDGSASLGPYRSDPSSDLTGDFVVEMTDQGPAIAPGGDVGGVSPITQVSVVLTSFGTVRPALTTADGTCDPIGASVSGHQALQATTVISPIFK